MRLLALLIVFLLTTPTTLLASQDSEEGWYSLFNGRDLSEWKVGDNASTFSVKDGEIVAIGPSAHLYYAGEVNNADFKDFELKCQVLTKPNANSGIFFHTNYQSSGRVEKGYEVQINQTHQDPRKTGGLFAVKDLEEAPVRDNQWFTLHVIVKGKRVVIKVNGQVTCDYTEPDNYHAPADRPERSLGHGTIALQGHDPGSEVHFRKIMVKPLD